MSEHKTWEELFKEFDWSSQTYKSDTLNYLDPLPDFARAARAAVTQAELIAMQWFKLSGVPWSTVRPRDREAAILSTQALIDDGFIIPGPRVA